MAFLLEVEPSIILFFCRAFDSEALVFDSLLASSSYRLMIGPFYEYQDASLFFHVSLAGSGVLGLFCARHGTSRLHCGSAVLARFIYGWISKFGPSWYLIAWFCRGGFHVEKIPRCLRKAWCRCFVCIVEHGVERVGMILWAVIKMPAFTSLSTLILHTSR